MPRPKLDPERMPAETKSMLAMVAWGRLTASEAAHRMRESPQTITRLVARLFGVSATQQRRKHADQLAREAMQPDPHRAARIEHQMSQAATRALSAMPDPDPAE